MRKRYVFLIGVALLAILTTLIVWQMSFNLGEYGPTNLEQTFVFWAVSTLVFLLAVTLGFMLFRTAVKLYLERQRNREGSRIQTKLFAGALALSMLPVVFLIAFSYEILNRNIEKWFMVPVEGIHTELDKTSVMFDEELQGRAKAVVNWLALRPDVRNGTANFSQICLEQRVTELILFDPQGNAKTLCGISGVEGYRAQAAIPSLGTLETVIKPRADLAEQQRQVNKFLNDYASVSGNKRSIRTFYLLFILLIALFILFVATWIALLLARQISGPILALLDAASEVRRGNLRHRVETAATDEMASLVRAFNEMTEDIETHRNEIESRRQFTEAILESIPSGVISLSSDGRIQRVNRAMKALFAEEELLRASTIADLVTQEQEADIRYLMTRARRVGVASSQMELQREGRVLHLSVIVSALPGSPTHAPGYVVVIEDTSELLRAQKAAAWHEVARRIAHELKNPLTPIALSAERIARQLDRGVAAPDAERVLRQCSTLIAREVESVKALADEFSQFSRFPEAQFVPADLNEIVRNGLDVFSGRLDGIDVRLDLAPDLPLANLDPEQMKRVVVNLVDNAAEAMRDSMVKRLLIITQVTSDTIELLVADTGRGVSADDKEKLFLPYFSTKGRGTGLGLAIVSHIVTEHGGRIRVEDNRPTGARFFVEIPIVTAEAPAPEFDATIESGARA